MGIMKMRLLLAQAGIVVLLLATVSMASAQTGAVPGPGGVALQNVAAATTQAQGIATVWGDSTAISANFNFGNPATTSTAALPPQVQDAIAVGEFETFTMALQALLF